MGFLIYPSLSRNSLPAVIALALFAFESSHFPVNSALAAQPAVSDEFSTSSNGWYPAQASNTNNELKHWRQRAAASDEFRTGTQDCLKILDEAAAHEIRYRELHEEAGRYRGTSRYMELHRAAGAENQITAQFIVKFWRDCVGPRMRKIRDGFDTRGNPDSQGARFDSRGLPLPAPIPPGKSVPLPPNPNPRDTGWRPPRSGPIQGRVERICDLQHLSAWVFRRYARNSGGPVARVKITNSDRPTYLLLLSGMEWEKLGQATLAGDALIAWANIQALDAYRLAILDAVADLDPRNTSLIIAGHSQGGMEAQDVLESLTQRWGYNVPQIITYGTPIVADRRRGTAYLHVRAPDDPVIAMDRRYNFSQSEILLANRGTSDPHQSYWTDRSGLSTYRVPRVSTLRTPCYEIDLTTLEEFSAPNLFRRFFGPTDPRQARGTRLNPGWTGSPIAAPVVNCFWASLAQDREWRTGLPIPAQCEAAPIKPGDIPPILARQYGGRLVDDLHPADRPTLDRPYDSPKNDGAARHRAGTPVKSSRNEIERLLPRGGQGVIFAALPDPNDPTKMDTKGTGHIFNVRRHQDGRFEYQDAQTGQDPTFWFGIPDLHVFFYRTN